MVETRDRGKCNPGAGEGSLEGGARRNEDRASSPPPPPPPPYNAEVFFAQFLWSQQNMEPMQQNMEAALCHITDNTRRGDNPGGHEVNIVLSRTLWTPSHRSLKRQ